MSNNVIFTLLSQLAVQSPLLFCYVAGMVAALIMWGRQPRAALLTLVGCAGLVVVTVGQAVLQILLIDSTARATRTTAQMSQMLVVLALAGSLLRAAAFGAVLFAVFVGRPAQEFRGFPVERV